MLYRARGNVLFIVAPAAPIAMPLTRERNKPRSPRRRAEARGYRDHKRPAIDRLPVNPGGDVSRLDWDAQGRPAPGLDTRLWDHDPAALFSNVYRLGPRSAYSARALIRHLERRGRVEGSILPPLEESSPCN